MKQYNSPRFVFFVLCIVFAIPFFTAQTQLSTAQTPFCALISTPTEFHQFDDGAVGNVEQIQSANWSPNGKYIAFWLQRISTSKIISDPEKWLQIWDASQTTKIVELVFDQYSYPTDITWSTDSSKLAIASSNHIRIWEGGLNWSPNVLEIDFLYRFEQVMWSSDGTQLFTTHVTNESSVPSSIPSFGNIVRRWDADTGELLKEFTRFEQAFFTAKGSELIVISRSDNQLSVWEAESEETFWSLPDIYFIGAVFTDEVQRLAVASIEEGEMVISVWDVSSNNRLLDLEGKYRLSVNLSPNGHSLQLINNDDFSSEIWDLRTGQQIELSVVDGYTLNSAYWSPDGECIISIGSQNLSSEGVKTTALILWRTADPDNLRILDTSEFGFNGVAWSTDSKQIAVINRTEISSEPHLQGEVYPSPPPAYSTLVKLWK